MTYHKIINAGTQIRSLRTGVEYMVSREYDPNNLRTNATVEIQSAILGIVIFVLADRFEQEFEIVN